MRRPDGDHRSGHRGRPDHGDRDGTVNPGGQATTWYVEYGTSTSYGSKTASVSAGPGTANIAVSASLTGLASGTTYHYRVVATNSAGTGRGADGIFTTSAGAGGGDGLGDERDADVRDAQRNRRSERPRDDVVLRVRDEHELRDSKTAEKTQARARAPWASRRPVPASRAAALYHYRLVATSDAGTSRGADQTFSTTGAPAVVTGRGELDRADVGAAERHRHAERPVDELVLRLRDEHELRRAGRRSRARARARAPRGCPRRSRACERRPPTTTAWSRRMPPGRPSAATGPSARPCRRSCARVPPRDVDRDDRDR